MVRHNNAPDSLEDFLNEQPKQIEKSQNDDAYKLLNDSSLNYKREEFRFPVYLSEKLRQASYKLNKKKTDIIQEALKEYLGKIEQ